MSARLEGGPGLILTRAECWFIAFAAADILAKHRRSGIASPRLRTLLTELGEVANSDPRRSDSNPVPRTDEVAAHQQHRSSGWLTTRAAAERLGISTRRVGFLLHEGRLRGVQAAPNGAWKVSEQSLEEYQADRPDRKAS